MRPAAWALIIGLGTWAVMDFILVEKGARGTMSRVVWDNMGKNPFISFLSGVAMAHLFWPQFRASWWVELLDFFMFTGFMCMYYYLGIKQEPSAKQ